MKYYIPTSSLNFNNILSTESISPKVFYEKRGFGYSRWLSIEENNIENLTILFDKPHMFERPASDMEDHAMLVEISTEDKFEKLDQGVFCTKKTIYLNPWQTKFYFFSDSVKRTVISLSDSSLETKLIRLYQRQMCVDCFDGKYPVVQKAIPVSAEDTNKYIEEDYIINKMKGLLYGYYIGANMSSSKEHILKLDSLREIQNIFSSIISSYDRIPSEAQNVRLNKLFLFLEQQQPLYLDLVKTVGDQSLVDKTLDVLMRYGYTVKAFDQDSLIHGLRSDVDPNPSVLWIKREIAKAKALSDSIKKFLNPDDAEIIVSSKEKVISLKSVEDKLMNSLFKYWTNNVLCSNDFNGKINSVKEALSDEITKAAKIVIGADWDNSPIRIYLNQLRRHVRGEEFNQKWDNGLLSSMAAVLLKGDEWEQMLYFMEGKGMYDYRLAYAIYGILYGFANMTRDFTDLLLNKDYNYLSGVYREFFGQLHDKDIPATLTVDNTKGKDVASSMDSYVLTSQVTSDTSITQWYEDIRMFATKVIKRDKTKLLSSLDEAFCQNGENRDYSIFLSDLLKYDGWCGKNSPSTAWTKLQEHYAPESAYNLVRKKKYNKKNVATEQTLFHELQESSRRDNRIIQKKFTESNFPIDKKGTSILVDTSWIKHCASFIDDTKAKKRFVEDMEWFVENHNDTYEDKKKGKVTGYYKDHDKSNVRVLKRLQTHLENKLNPKSEKTKWVADIYRNIPIEQIMNYIDKVYGN